ncbi:putative secreted protein (Por secretion system target) [Chitinophaga niastensis]|uniref:Putative secreted protein (Por secretion system target) n=1 Tax=Chitinophaga niastensis TaxID=536980 RepID=A0A2P8HET6_CHINA|nr:SGNH/GDSL hydrolase family protein [Chitinophaga niastensis]PSL44730.1 putative secreted protein (Por secretion system target) [Chitinophaga niastensis]
MRKIMLFLCLVCCNYYVNAQICKAPYHIVVIGSSTAAGMGATLNHGWVALYTLYLKGINIHYQVDNLAVGGYTTYNLCPTGFVPPPSRPLPDTNHNITRALSLHPDAIIINLPTNDVGRNYTLTEQQDNYKRMISAATAQGVKVWVTTTQPRNAYNAAQIAALKAMRDWTISYFGNKSIDFWTGLAASNDSIRQMYSYGDGTHLNDAGHQLLYTRVVNSNIPDTLCNRDSSSGIVSGDSSFLKTMMVPNPAQESCRIAGLTSGNHLVKIYDLSGRLVYINRQFRMGSSIAVGAWAKGMYVIVVDGVKQQLKLIKE